MKKDDSIMIRFTKKKFWLKKTIEDEAKDREDSRNAVILDSLEKVFIDKKPEKKK